MAQTAATRAIESAIVKLNKVIEAKNAKIAELGDELDALVSQRNTLLSTLPPLEPVKK